MDATEMAPKGAWVKIQQAVLTPGERVERVPVDTVATPLLQWVDGFLTAPAALGEEVTVHTIIGRAYTGVLSRINLGYSRSFDETVDEILAIGTEYGP